MEYVLIIIAALTAILSLFISKGRKWLIGIVIFLLVCQAFILYLDAQKQKKEAAKTKFTGILEPDSTGSLYPSDANISPLFEIGDSGVIIMGNGQIQQIMETVFRENMLTIYHEKGELRISTLIRKPDGSVIAEVKNNEWKVSPPKMWDRNYSKNAFEVIGENGDVVLQIRLLPDKVQFQGKFYDSNGFGVGFGVDKDNAQFPGIIEYKGTAVSALRLKIEPIFKYPSELHLGEFQ